MSLIGKLYGPKAVELYTDNAAHLELVADHEQRYMDQFATLVTMQKLQSEIEELKWRADAHRPERVQTMQKSFSAHPAGQVSVQEFNCLQASTAEMVDII